MLARIGKSRALTWLVMTWAFRVQLPIVSIHEAFITAWRKSGDSPRGD